MVRCGIGIVTADAVVLLRRGVPFAVTMMGGSPIRPDPGFPAVNETFTVHATKSTTYAKVCVLRSSIMFVVLTVAAHAHAYRHHVRDGRVFCSASRPGQCSGR